MGKKAVRRKQSISKDETKSERFSRVVTPRVNKAIKAIKVIGYCTGSSYEYTPMQSAEIIKVLAKAVDSLNDRFEKKAELQEEFTFTK